MDIITKIQEIENHFYRLEEQLADPSVISEHDRFASIHKEYKDLQELMDAYKGFQLTLGNMETAREMLDEPDPEFRKMAEAELENLSAVKEEQEEILRQLLIPKDPEDEKDVILEIRSGAGGDEASIFAGDLYRMYSRFIDNKGWKVEVMEVSDGSVGGYSKIVVEVKGKHAYGTLKFESGAHRVQRVPQTESQGRVHTSAATVVIMPKLEMEDVQINKADLRVDTFRSSGAGGQHVNKTESGVRFTHMPTGVVAESTEEKSQTRNREIAIQRLYQKMYEIQKQTHEDEQAAHRKSLVGTGDRSDKIRTYNYPQNRVTDHRINLTLYNLDKILGGELDEIIEALKVAENAEKMVGME